MDHHASEQTQALLERVQRATPVPLGVHLQIADRCNHACSHCYQVQGNKGELSTDQWLAVLGKLAKAGVLFLTVSGGEATLRPDLLDILRAARRLGFATRLFTNAFLVDEPLADRLAALHLLAVHVSVYSHVADEHDAITHVPGSWQRTTDGIGLLTSRRVPVMLKWLAMAGVSSSEQDMETLASRLGASATTASMVTAREDGDSGTTRAMMRGGDALVKLVAGQPAGKQGAERLDEHPCGMCRMSVAVMPNGDVQPCTALAYTLGHVERDDLAQLIARPDARFLREIRWRDVHGCRDCDLVSLCGRCHADALLQAGDLLGPYQPACGHAIARFCAETGLSTGHHGVSTGPFRVTQEGLQPTADALTPEDRERRISFPFTQRERVHLPLVPGCGAC